MLLKIFGDDDGSVCCHQVGHDKGGLPIGLQFIGRPWSEATLLHIAFAMQASLKI